MSRNQTYTASCFCGAVQLTLNGEPEAQGYCHCDSCRRWSAGPINAFTLWQPDNVEVTRGRDEIGGFDANPGSDHAEVVSLRQWCKRCGGHVSTEHPTMGLVDVPAAVIADLPFTPGFHVHYQESVQSIADGLPKFRDLPEAAGGSGREMPE